MCEHVKENLRLQAKVQCNASNSSDNNYSDWDHTLLDGIQYKIQTFFQITFVRATKGLSNLRGRHRSSHWVLRMRSNIHRWRCKTWWWHATSGQAHSTPGKYDRTVHFIDNQQIYNNKYNYLVWLCK